MSRSFANLARASVLALALVGCAGGNSATVQQIIDATRAACSFVPTVETILELLNQSGPFADVLGIANAICGAVTQPRARDAGPATVHGGIIRDRFGRYSRY